MRAFAKGQDFTGMAQALQRLNGVPLWRKARQWLKVRESELLAAGWTRRSLYGRGTGYRDASWGAAWAEIWGDKRLRRDEAGVAVDLEPGGVIRFRLVEADGRSNYLRLRPEHREGWKP